MSINSYIDCEHSFVSILIVCEHSDSVRILIVCEHSNSVRILIVCEHSNIENAHKLLECSQTIRMLTNY